MAKTKKNIIQNHPMFWVYLLCAVAISIVLLGLIITGSIYFFVDVRFLLDSACRNVEQTKWLEAYTYCFYGKEWDDSTYLSAISGFYSTVIVVLIAIQALISALAFVFVLRTNKHVIEDEVDKQLPVYFGKVKVNNSIKKMILEVSSTTLEKIITQKTIGMQDDISNIDNKFYDLHDKYEVLKSDVAILNGEGSDDDSDAQEGKIIE